MNIIRNTEEGLKDSRLDKFYDETPQIRFTFQLKVSSQQKPYELYYNERLDGTAEENKAVIEALKVRAQADMFNILTRLKSREPDCEFQAWRVLDENGVVLHESDILTITVKPQVGAPKTSV